MTQKLLFRLMAFMVVANFGTLSAFSQQSPGENFFIRDRYVAVTDRPQPEFDRQPIRLGAIEVTSEVATGIGYRSNLFFAQTNETEDGFVRINPTVHAETIWSRHQIGLDGSFEHTEYFSNSQESVSNFDGRAYGRFDIGSYASITAGAFGAVANEPRSAAGAVVNSVEPVEFDVAGFDLSAQYQRGRLKANLDLIADRTDFDDVGLIAGGTLDQDFRDTDEYNVDGRVDWAVDRDWSVFGRAAYVVRDTDAPTVDAPLDRDSDGVIVQVGTSFELPVLVRGEVAIGYQEFNFDDPAFGTVSGVAVDASLQWFVTELTTLSASVGRDVVDPGIGAAAGAFRTRVGIRADHELRRNVLLRAQIDYSKLDFESIVREDDRVDIGVGVVWKINRNVYVDASYQYVDQSSDFQAFDDNQVLIALRLAI